MIRMKRVARYLLEVPDPTIRYDSESRSLESILVYVDSDWAGCKASRKSTSGGAVTWGGGLLKSWSRTQGSQALSSGEAEFYAAIKGACEGLGIKSLLGDLGFRVEVEVIQDSTAAKGTASRAGVGKTTHLDVGWLWIQPTVREGEIKVPKIDGKVDQTSCQNQKASKGRQDIRGPQLRRVSEKGGPRRTRARDPRSGSLDRNRDPRKRREGKKERPSE